MNGMVETVKALRPKVVVFNGDMLDGARISRHARIGWAQTPTLKEELEAVQRFAHDIESAANIKKTKCDLEWNLGNHCMRFDNYVSGNASEAEGVIERLSDIGRASCREKEGQ